MRHVLRLFPIAVCLLLAGCVFAVDHEMEDDEDQKNTNEKPNDKPNAKPNGEEPDPDVSITGPEEVVYVDGDDFAVDYAITCEPEGCHDDLQCRIVQGESDPDFAPCDGDFTVTEDDVDEGVHAVEVQLFDGDEVLAEDGHQSVIHFEFDLFFDGLSADGANHFSHPHLGEFELLCTHPDCELTACGWSDGLDSDDDPDPCELTDPLHIEIPAGTADAAFTVSACAQPTWPAEHVDHCVETTYDFEYSDPLWTDVDTGGDYTCGILDDHTLWCWGNGHSGRLGLGDDESRHHPVEPVAGRWREISTKWHHTCAIDLDDQLYCWGRNNYDQVDPEESETGILEPRHMGEDGWQTVSAGQWHTCAIPGGERAGSLLCWGRDETDRLGAGGDEDGRRNVDLPPDADAWVDVSAGFSHTCAVARMNDDSRNLYCWGSREHGVLGDGEEDGTTPIPQLVDAFIDGDPVEVIATWENTCAIDDGDGAQRQAYCWGDNSRVGNTTVDEPVTSPAPVVFDEDATTPMSNVLSLTLSDRHACASIADGQDSYCWGDSGFDRLGNEEVQEDPELLPFPIDWSGVDGVVSVDTISAGSSHTCAIIDDGDLYCWGHNDGPLGRPDVDDPDAPNTLPAPTAVHWPFAPE